MAIFTFHLKPFTFLSKCRVLAVQVFQDGAVVPGWEGKIVAWVEEDHGERR